MRARKTPNTIDVGIYGKTFAGKTRFLYQLISYRDKAGRIIDKSPGRQKFLKAVENDIKSKGAPRRTVEKQDISFVLQCKENDETVRFQFRDLGGEFLATDLDNVESQTRDNRIREQVRECDAFIFFFDPLSSEEPSEIDNHHLTQLKRMENFIEYVARTRENTILPIVFVLTHLDLWESGEDVREKVETWRSKVGEALQKVYGQHLRRLHPTSIVDPDRVFLFISSVGRSEKDDKEPENVLMRVMDLVDDSKKHLQKLKPSSRAVLGSIGAIVGVVLFAAAVVLAEVLSMLTGTESRPLARGDRQTVIAELPEKSIRAKLDELERLIQRLQQGVELVTEDEAKTINEHLHWVQAGGGPNPPAGQSISKDTERRLRDAINSIGKIISKVNGGMNEKAGDDAIPLDERVLRLETFLEDLPDLKPISEELAQCQKGYWQAKKAQVLDRIARIIKRRDSLKSPCKDTLEEAKSELETSSEEVKNARVYGPQEQQNLIEDIKLGVTFCEDRINAEAYQVQFRIPSAKAVSDEKVELHWLGVRFSSGNVYTKDYLGLGPIRISERKVSYRTEKKSYAINLKRDRRVRCELLIYDSQNKRWQKLQEFELTADPGPLVALGLPLVNRSPVTKVIRYQGHEVMIEFFGFSPVPDLIWEAVLKANSNSENGTP